MQKTSTGLNAINALDELGILKPVMEKTDNKKTLRSFTFVSGYGQHEVVYNVSHPVAFPYTSISFSSSTPSILFILELEYTDPHFLMPFCLYFTQTPSTSIRNALASYHLSLVLITFTLKTEQFMKLIW